jgi:small conductance mechanosensitive channel
MKMQYEQFIYPAISFVVIILITWLVARLFNLLFVGWYKIGMSLIRVHVQRVATIVIWTVGLILAIEQFGFDLNLLLLLIGILGIGAILAARDVLQNLAAKYFSDVYIPFKLGDSIRIRDYSGKVIEINPVATVLLTEKEELVSIPNALFVKEATVNITPQAWKEIIIPIAFNGRMDVPEFESKVLKAINKFKLHLDERFPPVLTVKRRENSYFEMVLTLMIREPSKKDEITAQINKKIAELTDEIKRKDRKKA